MRGWPPEALQGAPRIGLGLAALGRPAYITTGRRSELGADRSPETLRRRTHAVLDAAYRAGVRYIDVARSYGCAESFLAGWLSQRRLGPDQIAVGSKWGYTYVGGWRPDAERHEIQDLSVDTLDRQLEETLEVLGANLALYQIHSATPQNAVLSSHKVLGAMRRLREQSVAVGVTVTGPHQAQVIDAAIELDLFDTIQATWNLLEPSSADALARAHAAGLTVIVKEALANGRLTSDGDNPYCSRPARSAGSPPTRSRSAPPSRNPGPTSCSAEQSRLTPSTATWPPAHPTGTPTSPSSRLSWLDRPPPTGASARSDHGRSTAAARAALLRRSRRRRGPGSQAGPAGTRSASAARGRSARAPPH